MLKESSILTHEFVDFIPADIKEGVLYVSMKYSTASHKCCCGCGQEVVTPFSPTDWKLMFDGRSISLNPSIGNWSFNCKSHYWIKNNKVSIAESWSQNKIDKNRAYDYLAKQSSGSTEPKRIQPQFVKQKMEQKHKPVGFWSKIRDMFYRRN
jgi:hypothetical protein